MTKSIKEALQGRQAELRAYAAGKDAFKRGHGIERYRERFASHDEWVAFCMGWDMARFWLAKDDKEILKGSGDHEPFE